MKKTLLAMLAAPLILMSNGCITAKDMALVSDLKNFNRYYQQAKKEGNSETNIVSINTNKTEIKYVSKTNYVAVNAISNEFKLYSLEGTTNQYHWNFKKN